MSKLISPAVLGQFSVPPPVAKPRLDPGEYGWIAIAFEPVELICRSVVCHVKDKDAQGLIDCAPVLAIQLHGLNPIPAAPEETLGQCTTGCCGRRYLGGGDRRRRRWRDIEAEVADRGPAWAYRHLKRNRAACSTDRGSNKDGVQPKAQVIEFFILLEIKVYRFSPSHDGLNRLS